MQQANSWVEISKHALRHNVREIRNILSKNTQIMTIVKSNAYGHGMIETAKTIESETDWFGVVSLQEAVELRSNGITKPIFILSYFIGTDDELKHAINGNIHFPLYNLNDAKRLNQIAETLSAKVNVHLKIDTGTSRLGILPDQVENFISELKKYPTINISGVFSHFASSEENEKYTAVQTQKFDDAILTLKNLGIDPEFKHIACSAATLVNQNSQYNLVRVGLSLYGLWPSQIAREVTQKHFLDFELTPALSWKTRPIQIKTLPANTSIGYGCTYTTQRETKIAVLPVGYWDGYDRGFGNTTQVLVNGKKCNVLGRICMNLCMIDISDAEKVDTKTEVVLLGKQGSECISAEELGTKIGTINYEIVTRIQPAIPRRFI